MNDDNNYDGGGQFLLLGLRFVLIKCRPTHNCRPAQNLFLMSKKCGCALENLHILKKVTRFKVCNVLQFLGGNIFNSQFLDKKHVVFACF